jgi:hypothetical protein
MIEFIAVLAVIYLVAKSQGGVSSAGATIQNVASQSPISNSTGVSLSAALGSKAAPPDYYSSGNPGYNATAATLSVNTQSPVVAGPSATTSPAPPIATPIVRPNPAVPHPVSSSPVMIRPAIGTSMPPKIINPLLANKPPAVTRNSPEVASAPWTKAPVKIISGGTGAANIGARKYNTL